MSYPIYLKPSHSRPNARRETRTPCFAKPEHASHQQLIILNDRRIAMAWVCNCCPNSSCWNCANIFDDLADAIEHIRKYHGINILGVQELSGVRIRTDINGFVSIAGQPLRIIEVLIRPEPCCSTWRIVMTTTSFMRTKLVWIPTTFLTVLPVDEGHSSSTALLLKLIWSVS